jgi:hypothetical protein
MYKEAKSDFYRWNRKWVWGGVRINEEEEEEEKRSH